MQAEDLGKVSDVLNLYTRRSGSRSRIGFGARPAVIVVDFQLGFTRGTEGPTTANFDKEVEATASLLATARGRAPIMFTAIAYGEDMSEAGLWQVKIPWLSQLREGQPSADIDERVAPAPGEPIIVKKYASCFHGTDLDARLKKDGIDTIILAGCTVSVCVRATAVDAMQLGYRVILAEECLGDFDPALRRLHMTDIDSRYGDVCSLAEVEKALLGVAA